MELRVRILHLSEFSRIPGPGWFFFFFWGGGADPFTDQANSKSAPFLMEPFYKVFLTPIQGQNDRYGSGPRFWSILTRGR